MIRDKKKVAYFAALSAFIGIFENLIPIPMPFLKLGLSNIPVCLSFTIFNYTECLYIIFFKLIFSHLFKGTLFSYPFLIGLAGNLLFITLTFPAYKLLHRFTSFITIGIIGAFSHNLGQLFAASFFIPSTPLFYYGVILLSVGIVIGFINGSICNILYNKIFRRHFI